MTQRFVNNFSTTVAATFGAADTFLQVASTAGLPTLAAGEYLLLTVFKKVGADESAHEVVKVTEIVANQLTVQRGFEGAAPAMFLTGDRVEARFTAAGADNMVQEAELTAHTGDAGNPHAVTAAQVGLGNVDNTSDATKAVLSATKLATARTIAGSSFDGQSNIDISYTNLTSKPTLGTAAAKDVPATGNASTTQVVMGSDTRLSDARTPTAHTHAISDVTSLQTALDGKSSTSHTHANATTAAAGFMSPADKTKLDGVATGATANATDAQLRDRSTHTGTQAISTVTGLQAALDAKQAALVSGTNIKTINSTSLLGSGNIAVGTGDVTLAGAQTLTNKTLSNPVINDGYTEEVYSVSTSGTVSLTLTNGSIQVITHTGAITFTDGISSGQSMLLGLTPGSNTTTWPATTWTKVGGSGTAPTLTATGVNWIVLWKVGTTLRGAFLGTA